jgi:hypothetical protein
MFAPFFSSVSASATQIRRPTTYNRTVKPQHQSRSSTQNTVLLSRTFQLDQHSNRCAPADLLIEWATPDELVDAVLQVLNRVDVNLP